MKQLKYYFIFLLLISLTGCSSTEEAVNGALEDYSERYLDEALPSHLSLDMLRTELSDVYTSRKNKVPEGFARIKVEKEVEKNLYEGYRIQIYSGQSVANADTIAAQFRVWSDTTIVGYQAETYVSFRTPYYKVHVGDFHDRNKAISFTKIVKQQFPDAWVVYDKVIPTNVPPDTAEISTK